MKRQAWPALPVDMVRKLANDTLDEMDADDAVGAYSSAYWVGRLASAMEALLAATEVAS